MLVHSMMVRELQLELIHGILLIALHWLRILRSGAKGHRLLENGLSIHGLLGRSSCVGRKVC